MSIAFDVSTFFASIGFIIVIGFLANLIFKRTKIPDVLLLMVLGLLLGPVLGLVDVSLFMQYSSYFAAVALMVILFEGGLHTDFHMLIRQSPRSFTLAIGCILLSMFAVAPIMQRAFGWPPLYGLLLGAMIGGSSSPIVLSITPGLTISKEPKTILNTESTLSDAMCIVIAIVLIEMIALGNYPLELAANRIVSSFSIGAVIGSIAGILWLLVLKRIKGKPFEYMVTLAVLMLVYAAIEKLMGSGAIGALAFGIVLGNSKVFSKLIGSRNKIVVDAVVKKFNLEISFLVRTFFFVYIGLLATINDYMLVSVGIAIAVALLFIRALVVRISAAMSEITTREKWIMTAMMPRGLAAAVLSQFPLYYGLRYASSFNDIIFVVIITSIVISSLAFFTIKMRTSRKAKNSKF